MSPLKTITEEQRKEIAQGLSVLLAQLPQLDEISNYFLSETMK